MMEEARSVWEGRVGDIMLTIQVHPSGRCLLLEGGSVKLVSDGLLSYKEAPYAE